MTRSVADYLLFSHFIGYEQYITLIYRPTDSAIIPYVRLLLLCGTSI